MNIISVYMTVPGVLNNVLIPKYVIGAKPLH